MANLLDRSSLVLTPTAYNNGEALCIKPDDASGDFTFSRNSAATRVNAQGLVENVQILSSNLVQNSDFSEEGVEEVSNGSFSQEGVEEITNGDFSSDTGWIKGTGWTISGGSLNASAATAMAFQQNTGIVTNKTYKVTYTISNYVSGSVRIEIGSANVSVGLVRSADGTYTEYITALGDDEVYFDGISAFTGSIDNVSVREVGQDWTLGTGWSIVEDKAVAVSGTASKLRQTNTLNGKTCKVTLTVSDYSSGLLQVDFGSTSSASIIANGDYVFYGTYDQNNFEIYKSSDFIGSITNISVKEVGQNWTFSGGAYLTSLGARITSAPTAGILQTDGYLPLVVGNNYKITYEIIENISGNLKFDSAVNNVMVSSVGVHTKYFEADLDYVSIARTGSTVDVTITNISIIEITTDTNLPRINYEGFSYQDALGSEEVVNGDFATDSDWGKSSNWTISGGTANSNGLSGGIYQNIGLVSGKTYKVNVEVSLTSGSLYVREGNNGSVAETITQSGNYSIYLIGGTATSQVGYIQFYSISFNGSIDNVSVKEYLGQEVVPDSGCGSWLFEPQSTNLVPYSESLLNWSNISSTLTSGLTSPSGDNSAYSVLSNGGSSDRVQLTTTGLIANTEHSVSVFVKQVGTDDIATLRIFTTETGFQGVRFDFNTKVLSNENGTTSNRQVQQLTNDWFRISYTFTTAATITSSNIQLNRNNPSQAAIYWGAQLEALSYPTSMIPTSGSTVTRNQDVCTNGGSLASINSTEGVLYAEIARSEEENLYRLLGIDDGTSNNSTK